MQAGGEQGSVQEQDLNGVFEIHGPGIDVEEILTRLRTNMRARRASPERLPPLPDFGPLPVPHTRDAELEYHLAQANETYNQIWVEISLAPSPATHVPVLGQLWGLVREQAHRLVLYYVEMLASRQVGFNEHVVGTLNRLAAAQEEIAMLREEVAELRRHLEAQ